MSFDNAPLPVEIEQGAQGGPAFKTSVIELSSGHEQRNEEWSNTQARYDVSIGIVDKTDFAAVVQHFIARKGKSRTWPFKDWTDYTITAGNIGTGDGANRDFQIVKKYTDVVTFSRTITRPIVAGIVVRVNGVISALWTHVGLGLIRFNVGQAPPAGHAVTVSCEFDLPVRYDTDNLVLSVTHFNAAEVPSIPIKEVRE